MTNTSPGGLGPQPTQPLERLFTGHIGAQPANDVPLICTVANSPLNTHFKLMVTINGLKGAGGNPDPAFLCNVEPRYHPGTSTADVPPAGTTCLVVFPPNDTVKLGFVLGFIGWPT